MFNYLSIYSILIVYSFALFIAISIDEYLVDVCVRRNSFYYKVYSLPVTYFKLVQL